MAVTLDTIAKLANTSKATVSLALNDRGGISPETKRKVMEVARQAGYVPAKRKVRAAGTQRVIRLLAVLHPATSELHRFNTSFFAELINSIQQRCGELKYSLSYDTVTQDSLYAALRGQGQSLPACGTILLGTYLSAAEISGCKALCPNLVVLDNASFASDADAVAINNFMGAYQSGAYLLSLGHRAFGYLRSDLQISNTEERRRGFLQAMRDGGLSDAPQPVFSVNSYQPDAEALLCARLAQESRLPTAFFCETDYNAVCLMRALAERGLRVPEDVSVAGFDNVPEAAFLTPRLTTVNVDKQAMGFAAVDRLHAMLVNRASGAVMQLIGTTLIEGRSCAAPNAR